MIKNEMRYIDSVMILYLGKSRYNIQSDLKGFNKIAKQYGHKVNIGFNITTCNIESTVKDLLFDIEQNCEMQCNDCDKTILVKEAKNHYGTLICTECYEKEERAEEIEIQERWKENEKI